MKWGIDERSRYVEFYDGARYSVEPFPLWRLSWWLSKLIGIGWNGHEAHDTDRS